ncbi:MAG: CRISPR-associated endonuclease Cas1 [Deltaproteobacteria bacterium]|nr:CRISPR-associated endonuclease Cas1 [Deltaproteobacteria bacterium]
METEHTLIDKAAHPDTLRRAWNKVRDKEARGGIDGRSVGDFEKNLARNLRHLSGDLTQSRYEPEATQLLRVPKSPGSSEHRSLSLLTVRDKIVQEAVRSVLEPILEPLFLECSYGYRPGKGPGRAIERARHLTDAQGLQWAVSADIDDFFGSIDHDILIRRLEALLNDDSLLHLILLWLKMGRVDGAGRWTDVYSGIGQGFVISPILANFYLHEFDRHVTEKGQELLRYADDFLILCPDRPAAENAFKEASDYLATELGLTLNESPHPISHIKEGFEFLGINFQERSLRIAAEKIAKMKGKMAHLTARPLNHIDKTLRRINEAALGWQRYYGKVVDATEAEKIRDIHREALVAVTARAFQARIFTAMPGAEEALAKSDIARLDYVKERHDYVRSVVREAFGKARQRENAVPATVGRAIRKKKRRVVAAAADHAQLIVQTPGCFIGKNGQRIIIRRERRTIAEIPATHLKSITVAGTGISISSDVVRLCAENDIPLLFIDPANHVLSLLAAPHSARTEIGTLQLRAADNPQQGLSLAKRFVDGKIKNQMSLMKYINKYRKRLNGSFDGLVKENLALMQGCLAETKTLSWGDPEHDRGVLFSIEGRAASSYWEVFKAALNGRADFTGRKRKDAADPVNMLLNYGYAVLQARVYQAALRQGLNPQISFLHCPQRSKPALVYDLIEEFRAPIVDRTVLAHLGRDVPLEIDDKGLLSAETRKRFLVSLHRRLSQSVSFRGKNRTLDEIIQFQALSLVRHLEGKERYRTYSAKW